MRLNSPLLLCLLSSTALALPTTNATSEDSLSLTKRKVGWLGSFTSNKCSGPPAHQVNLADTDTCYKFTPVAGQGWVGINYGSGDDWETCVTFYTDGACKTELGTQSVCQNGSKGMQCSNALGAARSFQLVGVEQ